MRDALVIAGLALAAVVLGGTFLLFGSKEGADTIATPSPGRPIIFETLDEGASSEVHMRVNYLISSEDQLVQLWRLIESRKTLPSIDFDQYAVVAVFAGNVPTGGYAISVSRVADTETARMVEVVLTHPGASCAPAAGESAPYQIIQVRKTDLPHTHRDTEETVSCL